jgi:glycosyltransferase involved in cell wall biosynthesis
MKDVVVCFGPGPQFKGGISNYNTSLAKALDKRGDVDVHIVSWTQQYPAIIPREFKDLKSKGDLLEGTNIKVKYLTNYNNILSWKRTVDYIKSLNPSKVIIQWSIALQGLPLGYIARKLAKNKHIEVLFDMHFVIQKENSSIDRHFTKMGIKHADTFLVHALKTFRELQTLYPNKNFALSEEGKRETKTGLAVVKLYHPIYDLFAPDPTFDTEAFKKEHGLKKHVFLYFGFIRKYKGLHNAIKAFAELAKERDDVSLVACGESFWNTLDQNKASTRIKQALFGLAKGIFLKNSDNEKYYRPLDLIDELGIKDRCLVVNEFIPNEDVHKYFQISDCVLLFYLYATPSGIESLSYNFDMPLLATNVGHFPETIKDGFNGYLVEPENIQDMKEKMKYFLEHPIPRENVAKAKEHMSWKNYAEAIMKS